MYFTAPQGVAWALIIKLSEGTNAGVLAQGEQQADTDSCV